MKKTLVGKLRIGNPFIASVLLKSCRSGIVAVAIGLTIATLPQIGLAQTSPAVKAATTLTRWTFDSTTNQLEVTLPEGITPHYFLMAQPARIVLDLPNTAIGTVATQKTYPGAVRQIRVSQFQPSVTRFVLELASDTVLAPGQVQLQQVGNASAKRWLLRPLIATTPASRPVSRQPLVRPTNSGPAAIVPPPTPVPSPAATPQIDNIPPGQGVAINVPPPSTTRVPIALPPATANPNAFSVPPTLASPLPTVAAPTEANLEPRNVAPILAAPALGLPPAEFPASQTVTVSVPTLSVPTLTPSTSPSVQPLPVQPLPPRSMSPAPVAQPAVLPANSPLPAVMLPDSALALPPARFEPNSAVTVKVPTLPSTPTPAIQPVSAPRGPLVEFGQPLPGSQSSRRQLSPAPIVAPRSAMPPTQAPIAARGVAPSRVAAVLPTSEPQILLPSGTLLNLRYSGSSALNLKVGTPRQEVLLLQAELRDQTGKVIPEGTPVLGRFESNNGGSRFIAQAITLQGRNVPLVAQSDPIDGGAQISQDSLLLGSGLGALAIGAIGGFNGFSTLGGAAVGAAVSYATAPRPATLQPGQVLQIRLTEALR